MGEFLFVWFVVCLFITWGVYWNTYRLAKNFQPDIKYLKQKTFVVLVITWVHVGIGIYIDNIFAWLLAIVVILAVYATFFMFKKYND